MTLRPRSLEGSERLAAWAFVVLLTMGGLISLVTARWWAAAGCAATVGGLWWVLTRDDQPNQRL